MVDTVSIGTMTIESTSRKPRLPQEIINNILHQSDNPPFLWAACRNVSKAFRAEVEYIFREKWLKETVIMWLKYDPVDSYHYKCRFVRLSPDGNTAYFDVSVSEIFKTVASSFTIHSANFQEFEELTKIHDTQSSLPTFFKNLRTVTRIGIDLNDTFISDLMIPGLCVHASREISVPWKVLFTNIFREEQLVSRLKTQFCVNTPTVPYIADKYPIVLIKSYRNPAEIKAVANDHAVRLHVRLRRVKMLGWDEPENDTREALDRHLSFHHTLRLEEIIQGRKLRAAECRGMLCAVEHPAKNGWKRWPLNVPRLTLWYNHAWEDERDGGRTTRAQDLCVVDAERMARAWEKALDWRMGGEEGAV